MPNSQGHRALVIVVAVALLAVTIGLVNAHKAASTPIVIQTPTGVVDAAATLPPVTAPKEAVLPDAPEAAPPAPITHQAAPALIYVHVAGAVKHPSLYQLAPNSRVWHAIKAAGGPTDHADENAVNLAAKVHDGEKIYVPTQAKPVQVAAVPKETAPMVVPAAWPVPTKAAHGSASAKSSHAAGATGAGKPSKLVSPSQGRSNINTASVEQLQELPGIGPAMAATHCGYRQQAGSFQKAEDLMNVGGIGPKKYARIAPLMSLH